MVKKNSHDVLEPQVLCEIVSEFRLGNFKRKDLFIETYAEQAMIRGKSYARYSWQRHDLAGVALLTLCNIHNEVYAGRLLDDNIVPYSFGRIRTRCFEYIKTDFLIPCSRYGMTKLNKQRLERINLEESNEPKSRIEDPYVLEEFEYFLKKSIQTEGERLVVKYRREGKNDNEIAILLGCSSFKIKTIRETVERRFENFRNANLFTVS